MGRQCVSQGCSCHHAPCLHHPTEASSKSVALSKCAPHSRGPGRLAGCLGPFPGAGTGCPLPVGDDEGQATQHRAAAATTMSYKVAPLFLPFASGLRPGCGDSRVTFHTSFIHDSFVHPFIPAGSRAWARHCGFGVVRRPGGSRSAGGDTLHGQPAPGDC